MKKLIILISFLFVYTAKAQESNFEKNLEKISNMSQDEQLSFLESKFSAKFNFVLGKKILSKPIVKDINVSNLKDGIYFLKLIGPNQTVNKKFIKQ